MSRATSLNQRDISIDLFKTFLVVGMVSAHVIQFLAQKNLTFLSPFSDYINLISFSGYLFAFGYSTYLAYFQKVCSDVWKKMLATAFKTLIAFYISGVAFRILVDRKRLFSRDFWNIILLNDVPGYSEFLLSFALVTLLALILFRPLRWLLEHRAVFWIVIALLLLTTFFPYDLVQSTQLGLLVGTRQFAAFPVLQYLPYYWLGLYFARYQIGWQPIVALGSLAFTLAFFVFAWQQGAYSSRFPPSLLWVMGAAVFLYVYYLFAKFLARKVSVYEVFLRPGKNVLFYLLISNILIFSLATVYRNALGFVTLLSVIFGLLYVLHFLVSIIRRAK
jgi:hypothetical protein